MVHTQEMTHPQFVDAVDRLRAMGRTVGLWPNGVTFTDDRRYRGRWWQRRTIDHGRLVVYIARARRSPAAVRTEIRRAIVRYGGGAYPADVRLARAAALKRLADKRPFPC